MASALAARWPRFESDLFTQYQGYTRTHACRSALERSWNGPLLSLPTLAHDRCSAANACPCPRGAIPYAYMRVSGRAHSTAMRAMTLACMDRDDDAHGKRTVECDWRKRGWGVRGNEPHPKHALERRQYPLCGCEILSVYPPTDYTRQQRSAYGDTPTARPPPKMRTTARQA
jgi:hypothetical protein